jgi:hypothetical protein
LIRLCSARSRKFRDDNTIDGKNASDVNDYFKSGKAGFVKVPVEVLKDSALEKIKEEHGLSARVMPFVDEGRKVLLAKAY